MFKNSSSTKRALIASAISLLLCVAMLAGSTLAWFNDMRKVDSKISIGNLKINLQVSSDGKDYNTIIGKEDIFDTIDNHVWEPGYTKLVYLKVENLGSLAAKFDIGMNVSGGSLGNVLEYVVLDYGTDKPGAIKYENFDELKNNDKVSENENTLTSNVLLKPNGELDGKTTDDPPAYYLVLAVHMKENVGYTYMNSKAEIEIYANATQDTVPRDSFGENYDLDEVAKYHSYSMGVNYVNKWGEFLVDITENEEYKSSIERVVFGRWNDYCDQLPDETVFEAGKPLLYSDTPEDANIDDDVAADVTAVNDADRVRAFYDSETVYILVDNDYGFVQAPDNLAGFFEGFTALKEVDMSCLDTSNVTDMSDLFNGCESLEAVTFAMSFNTANVTDMQYMFNGCAKLKSLDLSCFDTHSVTSMAGMFSGCSALTTLDLTSFNTANVIHMQYMFNGCTDLQTIFVSNGFVTTALTDVGEDMFKRCEELNQDEGSAYMTNDDDYEYDLTYAHIGTADNPGYFTLG